MSDTSSAVVGRDDVITIVRIPDLNFIRLDFHRSDCCRG
jgi:hypothetical protein